MGFTFRGLLRLGLPRPGPCRNSAEYIDGMVSRSHVLGNIELTAMADGTKLEARPRHAGRPHRDHDASPGRTGPTFDAVPELSQMTQQLFTLAEQHG